MFVISENILLRQMMVLDHDRKLIPLAMFVLGENDLYQSIFLDHDKLIFFFFFFLIYLRSLSLPPRSFLHPSLASNPLFSF